MSRIVSSPPAVAEVQGMYGAFAFPERLLQKIWLRGDFARGVAHTVDGRSVRVVHPGRWNLLGGPDFIGARLRFGPGPEVTGDIEVHLHASDWEAHAHAEDPAYRRVILHVVLFPTEPGRRTRGWAGKEIPVLVLLPLLHHALEEFAAEDAVETLADRVLSRLPEELGRMPATKLIGLLQRHAERRWEQKVHFARLRVQRLGWSAACHHTVLEILGYRFNRAPMLRVAGEWPLAEWAVRGTALAEEAYAAERPAWSLQGVRPANHPRSRLRQYAGLAQACADWPARLLDQAAELPTAGLLAPTREARRAHAFSRWRTALGRAIGANGLEGTRFDTLLCDGLFPLLAAQSGSADPGLWYHWYAGDLPPTLAQGLRQIGVFDGFAQPACHGLAQGLLGWLIERDAQARRL